LLRRISRIPNASFAKKVEAGTLDYTRPRGPGFCAEEHGCAENPFERSDQPTVFGATLLHPERFQHLGGTSEPDRLAFLPHRQSGEKDGHDPILTIRYAELGCPVI
jgi:hypothetical protein